MNNNNYTTEIVSATALSFHLQHFPVTAALPQALQDEKHQHLLQQSFALVKPQFRKLCNQVIFKIAETKFKKMNKGFCRDHFMHNCGK
ncbi:hypothetical protein EVAR_72890_1 [Eumeta japonica]|uniref:Uncharacterized protein n=1 Tax=Eumeta variegata TaxID=151549 RepID=A0A4C1T2H4_EUMVA|nr:hypothetical protein EVAR_72890_1 [Eumeta japonica]